MTGHSHPRLSQEEMQWRFNRGEYWKRMQNNEFKEVVTEYHPQTAYPEVIARHPGAQSVTTQYLTADGALVAELHYFRMPDGSVIPGKRPDPKLLFEDGVLYHQEKKKNRLRRLATDRRCPQVECQGTTEDATPPESKIDGKYEVVKIACTTCGYETWRMS
jgi:hypothetical protein